MWVGLVRCPRRNGDTLAERTGGDGFLTDEQGRANNERRRRNVMGEASQHDNTKRGAPIVVVGASEVISGRRESRRHETGGRASRRGVPKDERSQPAEILGMPAGRCSRGSFHLARSPLMVCLAQLAGSREVLETRRLRFPSLSE